MQRKKMLFFNADVYDLIQKSLQYFINKDN